MTLTANQYRAALDKLRLSQVGVARLLGVSEKTPATGRAGACTRLELVDPPGDPPPWWPQKLTPWVTMARRPALAAVHDHKRLGGIREIEGSPGG